MSYVYKKSRIVNGRKVKAGKWTCVYRDPGAPKGRSQAPGYRDKQASEAKARQHEKEAERRAAGLEVVDRSRLLQKLALEVLPEYLADLERRGASTTHRRDCRCLIAKAAAECGWATLGDVRAPALRTFLDRLHAAGRSARAQNAYLTLCRGMMRWCVDRGYIPADPLAAVKRAKEAGERPRRRGAYSPDELARLLVAAPPGRAAVYAVAAYSGLRRTELKRIQPRDLDGLETGRPLWRLRKEVSKNRRAYTLPMLPECAAVLRTILASRTLRPTDAIFQTVPRIKTLYADLAEASPPVGLPRADGKPGRLRPDGRRLDFHSLRYFFATQMANRLPIQKVKLLMRHRTIQMTMDLYADLGLEDVGEDVWTLAPISAPTGASTMPSRKEVST